ncbi:chorismate synthase [Lacrimispora saccharolytica]|uniref:Chorismate synthase n=1 Tax=Lacrimispora saccharolytica (strain ATCC 35040 / DSM 2544 / NRCC 2533 / WM1) TaxID=610130 RepID=D9R0H4_LACSW|nr:chorismate synthase [Lacrimispora saccharolytica]ADL06407.1 chorismate synthase [[Clostridium] saccharolyticum WM1]QRV19499.1 chorismate synthase [Lacrimispora saccharolytica]
MAGSTLGTIWKVTTWGESHGKAIGVVVDGCPAGLKLEEADIQVYLDRRKPGQSKFTTKRQEADQVEILSGVFEGMTTGTPISMVVWNTDQRSHDYGNIMEVYRPGHADFTFDEKYGIRDYRGGGRSSGRETIGRVAAGAVAACFLKSLGITVTAYTRSVGPYEAKQEHFNIKEREKNRLFMPDQETAALAEEYLEEMMEKLDSVGGVVECIIDGVPAGIGDPVFDKYDAALAKAVLSIGAVKGFEIGDGFMAARALGSQNNDGFCKGIHKSVEKTANHAGGILGGISDGSQVVLRAAFKPTPSVAQPQKTVTRRGEETEIRIKGRHDPIVVPRAVVVVEAMAALTTADLLLANMASRMDKILEFYGSQGARNGREGSET